MTVAQVERFFQAYAEAFSRFDADAVCRLWAYPACIAGRGRRAALDEDAFRANTTALVAFYRARGVAAARKRVLDVTPLTETIAAVRTADTLLDRDGAVIAAWEHAYLLSDTAEGLRAIAALPDAELAAWQARGTPLGTW